MRFKTLKTIKTPRLKFLNDSIKMQEERTFCGDSGWRNRLLVFCCASTGSTMTAFSKNEILRKSLEALNS